MWFALRISLTVQSQDCHYICNLNRHHFLSTVLPHMYGFAQWSNILARSWCLNAVQQKTSDIFIGQAVVKFTYTSKTNIINIINKHYHPFKQASTTLTSKQCQSYHSHSHANNITQNAWNHQCSPCKCWITLYIMSMAFSISITVKSTDTHTAVISAVFVKPYGLTTSCFPPY